MKLKIVTFAPEIWKKWTYLPNVPPTWYFSTLAWYPPTPSKSLVTPFFIPYFPRQYFLNRTNTKIVRRKWVVDQIMIFRHAARPQYRVFVTSLLPQIVSTYPALGKSKKSRLLQRSESIFDSFEVNCRTLSWTKNN